MTREEGQKVLYKLYLGPKARTIILLARKRKGPGREKEKRREPGVKVVARKGVRDRQDAQKAEGGRALSWVVHHCWTAGQLGGGWMVRSFLPSFS